MTEPVNNIARRPARYIVFVLALVAPVIIYFYFLPWKTSVAYGDDLFIYRTYESFHNFFQKISIPVAFSKCRPVHGLSIHLLISIFEKNTDGYYYFNIFIQAVNTLLFACTLHIFLRSAVLSILFGLAIGLSRFAFFNITQLLNGGALEGLALTFFLSALFFIVKVLANPANTAVDQQRGFIWALLFTNLCIYTHERYIVLFLFILLLIWLFPSLKLGIRQKLWISFLAVASIVLNVFLKKAVYGMPFFMGTASTSITFSYAQAVDFLTQGISSIFSINKGPVYLVGLPYSGLSVMDKAMVIVLLVVLATILFLYIRAVKFAVSVRNKEAINRCWLFVSLLILFGLCLLPALLTIRLEQRWLQAPYCIFILLLVIAITGVKMRSHANLRWGLPVLFVLLQWVDYNYLRKGADNIYLSYSEEAAADVETAVHRNIIHPETRRLFIWEKQRNANTEDGINWELCEGYIFNFYGQPSKQLIFIDTVYSKKYPFPSSPLASFSQQTDQVIYYDTAVVDITSAFVEDSLRTFSLMAGESPASYHPFPNTQVLIKAADVNQYLAKGFYENENGIRWTNGHASIGFAPATIRDSLLITLETFLPPASKNIRPVVSLQNPNGEEYLPASSTRSGDTFTYRFFFASPVRVQSIQLLADTINAGANDQRTLSFPMVSIAISPSK